MPHMHNDSCMHGGRYGPTSKRKANRKLARYFDYDDDDDDDEEDES